MEGMVQARVIWKDVTSVLPGEWLFAKYMADGRGGG